MSLIHQLLLCMVSKNPQIYLQPCDVLLPGPPRVQELPQQVHVVLGEEFQITCTATNDQDAPENMTFTWKTRRAIQFNETTTGEDDGRTASSTLHISIVTKSHDSKYTCNVRNFKRGSIGTSLTLIVEGIIHLIFSFQCNNYIVYYREIVTTHIL